MGSRVVGRRIVKGEKIKFNLQTDLQQLVTYMHSGGDDYELSPELEDKVKKMERCADLIRSHKSRLRVIPILMKRFGISRRVSYNLYQDTLMLFSDKPGSQRGFWIDVLIGGVADSIKAATRARNFGAVAAMRKLEKEIIDDFYGDTDANPYKDLQPAPVFIGFYPQETRVVLPKSFEKDLAKIKEKKTRWLNQDDIEDAKIIDDEA